MIRAFWLAAALAAGLAPARAAGFLVFDGTVANYAPDARGRLAVVGTLKSGRIGDFFAAHGRIFRLERLRGRAVELKADLTPLREAAVKSETGVPEWVGAWDKGVLVFCDNAVVYLDEELAEAGRTTLEPRKSGGITPVLRPEVFAVLDGRGYLLVDTNEVYVLPLGAAGKGPLRPEISIGYEQRLAGLWLDPADRTLNLLATVREEDPPRVVKRQRVLAYDLSGQDKAPRSAVVHERVEVRVPRRERPKRGDDEGGREGLIIERLPPDLTESSSSGAYIGLRSHTTPAYAETFSEGGDAPFPRRISRLGTLGALAPAEAGLRFEPDMAGGVLRLQPELYGVLTMVPGLREHSFKTLSY